MLHYNSLAVSALKVTFDGISVAIAFETFHMILTSVQLN